MNFLTILGISCLIAILWECLPLIAAACFIVFLVKYFPIILLICIAVFLVFIGLAYAIDYFKYRNETPKERTERLKREEMLEKWRSQFK